MIAPPAHKRERERLDVLRKYHILDTPPEKGFDDVTYLASFICKTPMAVVTFIDRDRQWFKSRLGVEVPQSSRSSSFCAYTILQTSVLVIPDTSVDTRFAENPMVKGDAGVRFYAGAPIFSSDGLPLGSVGVMDRTARTLTAGQEESLRALSRLGSSLLEMRRSFGELTTAVDSMNQLSELLPICSSCRRLKTDAGEWMKLEQYVRTQIHPDVTHGICPDCAKRLYPDYIRS